MPLGDALSFAQGCAPAMPQGCPNGAFRREVAVMAHQFHDAQCSNGTHSLSVIHSVSPQARFTPESRGALGRLTPLMSLSDDPRAPFF